MIVNMFLKIKTGQNRNVLIDPHQRTFLFCGVWFFSDLVQENFQDFDFLSWFGREKIWYLEDFHRIGKLFPTQLYFIVLFPDPLFLAFSISLHFFSSSLSPIKHQIRASCWTAADPHPLPHQLWTCTSNSHSSFQHVKFCCGRPNFPCSELSVPVERDLPCSELHEAPLQLDQNLMQNQWFSFFLQIFHQFYSLPIISSTQFLCSLAEFLHIICVIWFCTISSQDMYASPNWATWLFIPRPWTMCFSFPVCSPQDPH